MNNTIDDALREAALPMVVDELYKEKKRLEHEVRKYILKTFGMAIVAYIAVGSKASLYNGNDSNMYELSLIARALVFAASICSLLYFGYRTAQSYSSFSGARDELGIAERELSEIKSRYAPE